MSNQNEENEILNEIIDNAKNLSIESKKLLLLIVQEMDKGEIE